SRARNGARSVEGPTDTAASTRARAVIDLEPGRRTVVRTGALAVGAVQGTRGGTDTGTSVPERSDSSRLTCAHAGRGGRRPCGRRPCGRRLPGPPGSPVVGTAR